MALTRSEQMSRIRGRDTQPELAMRRQLWGLGLRYRLHDKGLPGRPDLVFAGAKLAVFIDGCQWHGCPDHYVRPRSNEPFWAAKLAANVERDCRQTRALEAAGWRVERLWEHEVRQEGAAVAQRVLALLEGAARRRKADFRVHLVEVLDARTDVERRSLIELRTGSARVEERVRSTSKTSRARRG